MNILDKFAGKENYAHLAGCKERFGRLVVDVLLYYPSRRRVSQLSNGRLWKRKGAKGDVLMVRPQPPQQRAVEYFHECERRLEEEYPMGFSASPATVEEVAEVYLEAERERKSGSGSTTLRRQAALAVNLLPCPSD